VTRTVLLAVLGILFLGVVATAVIHVSSNPGPATAGSEPAQPGSPSVLGTTGTDGQAAGPVRPQLSPVPPDQVKVGAPPPTLSSNEEERTAAILEMRRVRREDSMDQLNARAEARRKRLGLPAPTPVRAAPARSTTGG